MASVIARGLDYSWIHPDPSLLVGYDFVARYYSRDLSKSLQPLETLSIVGAHKRLVTCYEDSAQQARLGAPQGTTDGNQAKLEAARNHQPPDSPIYCTYDWNAAQSDWPAIAAYTDAFREAWGGPVGGYGDFFLLQQLLADGHISYTWQTSAWSQQNLLPGVNIYQTGEQVVIGGVTCDVNQAQTADYGSWIPYGVTPGGSAVQASDFVRHLQTPDGYYHLQANGRVDKSPGAQWRAYAVMRTDGDIYQFPTTTQSGVYWQYSDLPADLRQGPGLIVDIWLVT